ncbi:hypothetical protein E3P99_00764 [Wallemia hederae]|uniref:Uncharacterized protein n=1 Tax=Wallemia hederae TaxID=1540922 RepID=A0A4T0FTT7_9BASI|nr:hypothetical protein E3P99_00764 [Wallemia hederae]
MTNILNKLKKDSSQSPTEFDIPDVFVTPPEDDNGSNSGEMSGPYIAHRGSMASDSSSVFNQHPTIHQQPDEFQVRVDLIKHQSRYQTFEDLPSDDEEEGESRESLGSTSAPSPRSSRIKLRIDTSVEMEERESVNSNGNVLTASTSSSFSPDTPTHSLTQIPESQSKRSLNSLSSPKKSLRKRISTHFHSHSTQKQHRINRDNISCPSPTLPPIAHIHHKDNRNNSNLIIDQVKIRAKQLESLGFDKKVFDSDAIIHALGHGDSHTQDEIVGIAT